MRAFYLLMILSVLSACAMQPDGGGAESPTSQSAGEKEDLAKNLPVPQIGASGDEDSGDAEPGAEDSGPEDSGAENSASENGEKNSGTSSPGITLAADVPYIYMTLQPAVDGAPTAVIFAIDNSRDDTPSDDYAIRLVPEISTPEKGRCYVQQLRQYDFPEAAKPVYSPHNLHEGVDASQLPAYLAVAVSTAMIEAGLAGTPEQTRPQNVCTRKFWESEIIRSSTGQG